jgi:hypothetical protein
LSLTGEEAQARRKQQIAAWRERNPDYFKDYAKKHVEELRIYYKEYYREARTDNPEKFILRSREGRHKTKLKVIEVLGGRCANPDCRWLNEDGTVGCNDTRLLEVDHIHGGGRKEVEAIGYHAMMRSIIEFGGQGKYQLLCRCCNHLKRIKNGEHGKGKSACH